MYSTPKPLQIPSGFPPSSGRRARPVYATVGADAPEENPTKEEEDDTSDDDNGDALVGFRPSTTLDTSGLLGTGTFGGLHFGGE